MMPADIMDELSGVILRFTADCAKPYNNRTRTGRRTMDLRISNWAKGNVDRTGIYVCETHVALIG